MSSVIIITRPKHDLVVRYLSQWAKRCVRAAKKAGRTIYELEDKRASRQEFESFVRKFRPRFLHLNGHGSEYAVTGDRNQPLVSAGKNESLLSGTITYALSCSSAAVLGPAAVKAGAVAFAGYQGDFVFMRDTSKRMQPQHDTVADRFLRPAMLFSESIIKGNSVEQAIRKTKRAYSKNIRKLLTSAVSADDGATLRYLLWDMQNLRAHGDLGARLDS